MGADRQLHSTLSPSHLAICLCISQVPITSVLSMMCQGLTHDKIRNIAVRLIFHTVDLYFGEDQENARENLNRGLDIFDRVKADPIFAQRIKVLRLHWAYEEGDMLDLMISMSLPSASPIYPSLD